MGTVCGAMAAVAVQWQAHLSAPAYLCGVLAVCHVGGLVAVNRLVNKTHADSLLCCLLSS